MIKIEKTVIVQSILMILITIWLIHTIDKFETLYTINDYGYEAIKEDSVYFRIDKVAKIDLSRLLKGDIIQNATLMIHTKNTNLYYEVIYTQGHGDIFNGQYFNNSDFLEEYKKAVIGSSIKESIGLGPLYINQKEYAVIGTIPVSKIIPLNKSIFYTRGDISNVACDSLFVLASSNKKHITKSLENFKRYLTEHNQNIKIKNLRETLLNDFINHDKTTVILLYIVIILLFLMMIINLIFWLYKKEEERKVYFIIGLKFYWLKASTEIVVFYSLSFVLSFIIHKIFLVQNAIELSSYISIYIVNIILIYIVTWIYRFVHIGSTGRSFYE